MKNWGEFFAVCAESEKVPGRFCQAKYEITLRANDAFRALFVLSQDGKIFYNTRFLVRKDAGYALKISFERPVSLKSDRPIALLVYPKRCETWLRENATVSLQVEAVCKTPDA